MNILDKIKRKIFDWCFSQCTVETRTIEYGGYAQRKLHVMIHTPYEVILHEYDIKANGKLVDEHEHT